MFEWSQESFTTSQSFSTSHTTIKMERQLAPKRQDQDLAMKFIDLRATYDLFLIDRFYDDIIMANFPIEEERDDLEWFQNGLLHTAPEYLDPKDPLLFVVIAMAPEPTGPNEKYTFENCGASQVDKSLPIAGAIAFEYFKSSNCGLVTYIVTQPAFNRKGIARRLMELAFEKLNQVVLLEVNLKCLGCTCNVSRLAMCCNLRRNACLGCA
jgi:hypothetical protein